MVHSAAQSLRSHAPSIACSSHLTEESGHCRYYEVDLNAATMVPGSESLGLVPQFLLKALTRGALRQMAHQGFPFTDAQDKRVGLAEEEWILRIASSETLSSSVEGQEHMTLAMCAASAGNAPDLKFLISKAKDAAHELRCAVFQSGHLTAGNRVLTNAMTMAVDYPMTRAEHEILVIVPVPVGAAHLRCVLLLLKARRTLTPAQLGMVREAIRRLTLGKQCQSKANADVMLRQQVPAGWNCMRTGMEAA
ncbi:hypothetical protein MMC29_001292 [Sticta canariensis]|nr:hypothetical protein [Sticta canariensis]